MTLILIVDDHRTCAWSVESCSNSCSACTRER